MPFNYDRFLDAMVKTMDYINSPSNCCTMSNKNEAYHIPEIRKVYINGLHTTIEWVDGTKTTVGCMDGEHYDEYAGFAAAVLKKMFGTSRNAVKILEDRKVITTPKARKKPKDGVAENA